jgi:hypothetical protein
MRPASCSLAITVAAFLVFGTGVSGQEHSPVQTSNPTLQASLDRIARGSALWRADRDSISMAGRRAIVLTPDAVVVVDPTGPGTPEPFGNNVLAEISVLPGSGSEVETVLVVVNLPLLTQAHDRRRSSAAERAADLDRILVHEVYGHAFPYLLAGSLS